MRFLKKQFIAYFSFFLLLGSLFGVPAYAGLNVSIERDSRSDSLADQIKQQYQTGAQKAEIGEAKDPRLVIAEMIKLALEMLGTVFLVLVVIGGYHYFSAAGDDQKTEKGKSYIRNASIGFTIVMVSYSITLFVGQKIQESVAPGSTAGGVDPTQSVLCCDLIWKGVVTDRAETFVVQDRDQCLQYCSGRGDGQGDDSPTTCNVSTLPKAECK
ncbi:MAG: hypothetical protein COV59_04585 [Candidatus Magasanikbacteria bacterium CG11_big_fil_rev_8_21_14_0_20_39_34]|uniref:Uncharacterized protein n=1 Tax=Candidatus Magasanikbacteria bacterium CG11_big_fil_rev_8_21_14_0_20_39_34 TaxID=1974653 RepID=A0A2H0N498_9BACT|nr:MAG: hypothetical protein COV59_04585 [Candidatus Magasanikbacteria bacterium CG11_big_fil_rev_8_21_14_0_20_39_34]